VAAEYGIDLLLTIKNSNKLKQLNKDFKQTNEEQKRVRQGLKEMDKGYKKFFPSLNKIVSLQSKAQEMFNKTALGTRANTMAAKDLVAAQRLLNHELQQRNKLLKEVRGGAFESNIVQNVGRSQRARARSGFAAFSNRASEVSESAKTEAIKEKARERHLKSIGNNVAKIATIQTQQQAQAAFSALPGGTFGMAGGQIGPRQPLHNRLGFGKNALGGPFAMPGGAMGRLKGGAGSAMIGGGFPLLFGAGGLSAVMGGIAGGIGGALAPGGGFAASIAATALAAQIEDAIKFRKELKLVNNQLVAVGSTSSFTRQEIKDLAKQFNITKEEATQLIDSFVPRFENKADVKALTDVFGKDGLAMFEGISGATDSPGLIAEIVKARDVIGQTKSDELLADLKTEKSLEVQLRLVKEIARVNRNKVLEDLELNRKIDGKRYENVVNENLRGFLDQIDPTSELGKLLKDIELSEIKSYQQLARRYGGDFKFLKEAEEIFRKDFYDFLEPLDEAVERSQKLVEFGREYALQLQEFEEFRAPVDEIERLSRATRVVLDVSKELKDSFAESFKGIVKGTMTVTDAFRNMLNRIGDYFLDLAAQILAAGIQKSFLGLFQNMFNIQMPSPMAEGGRVTGGKPYIVGERGPELFSPGVSGNITPNHELGGSTNIVVNVDASGSNVEGDEERGKELGRLISVAVQSEIIQQQRPGGLLA